MHPRAEKIQRLLKSLKVNSQVLEFPKSTATALEAAQALGCEVAQIAKSIVFRSISDQPILVVASGVNRIDEKKIEEVLGEKIEKADANFVLSTTGFSIGGVPPIGHSQLITTFIDEDLLKYPLVWAAAGTPKAVFSLSPQDLVKITQGKVISVKKN